MRLLLPLLCCVFLGTAFIDAQVTPSARKSGIRLPQVEAPTARIDGLRNDVPPGAPGGRNFCFLFGRTEPFDAATLAKVYPTHESFVRKFNAAVDEIVRPGYWLEPEGTLARAAAAASRVGK